MVHAGVDCRSGVSGGGRSRGVLARLLELGGGILLGIDRSESDDKQQRRPNGGGAERAHGRRLAPDCDRVTGRLAASIAYVDEAGESLTRASRTSSRRTTPTVLP